MSTKLTFEAPADLSVGWVRVQTQGKTLAEWIATPSEKTRIFESVAPGVYTAFIEPLGQPPRPYIFEVRADVANTVVTPALSVLAAQGPQVPGESLYSVPPFEASKVTFPSEADDTLLSRAFSELHGATIAKALTIGLSQDDEPGHAGGWRPYSGDSEPKVELTGGALYILLYRCSNPLAGPQGQRLRLTASIQATRVERMMVPLFAGGTRIIASASPLTTADLAFRVIPIDTERRALIEALQSGVLKEAEAVRDDVLRDGNICRFLQGDAYEDPWAAVTAALLTLRFPELFGPKQPEWAPYLVKRYPWLPDAHILAARHALTTAGASLEARLAAAGEALQGIRAARRLGAPYFTYTNQLIGELLGALGGAALGTGFSEQVDREMLSWRSDVPLQRSAGAVFSWLMSNKRGQAAGGSAAPYTATRGNLDERYARILFRGQVDLRQIGLRAPTAQQSAVQTGRTAGSPIVRTKSSAKNTKELTTSRAPASKAAGGAPALRRRVVVSEDPNKGRFGRRATRGGYRLDVTFEGRGKSWIGIALKVTADPKQHAPNYSDVVEFFLHDSFDPDRLSVAFQGYEAKLKVFALGGFTVGAWLPAQRIELELDLALVPGAPRVIREL